ncbi:hypothetical protein RQP46_008312 [Phenoliferia psychrophenolica]
MFHRGSVYVVAHPDDSLLFQSPDLLTDLTAGNCVTTVYLTSGDSGIGSTYARSRESGAEAAYAEMMGCADQYTEFNATFGGQPVLIRTLTAFPSVQKVWFRLPDGDVDGSGYSSTSYQTLRELYFGSIPSITNQPGTSVYTLATLQKAIAQILSARQPIAVRTLDYLSQYDAGDHSDHITTARIVQGLVGSYAPNATLAGYMGYPVQALAPTLSTSSSQFNCKTAAFFVSLKFGLFTVQLIDLVFFLKAYTPYDSGECQSNGLAGTKLLLTWPQTYNLTGLVLFDRPNLNDQILSATLTFSDYSSMTIGPLYNDGSATVIPLASPILTSFILLTVTSVSSSTGNTGLAEFQAYGTLAANVPASQTIASIYAAIVLGATDIEPNYQTDVALFATATASSQEEADSGPEKAIDGRINGYPSKEWASKGEGVGAWLQLMWPQSVTLQSLVLFDRLNTNDWVKAVGPNTGAVLRGERCHAVPDVEQRNINSIVKLKCELSGSFILFRHLNVVNFCPAQLLNEQQRSIRDVLQFHIWIVDRVLFGGCTYWDWILFANQSGVRCCRDSFKSGHSGRLARGQGD